MTDIDTLQSFIGRSRTYHTATKEFTLFGTAGRGYYENPASDLLAFFMRPDAAHGLKDLFLATFMECARMDDTEFDTNAVDIWREVLTEDAKRIDLQILGPDWCLLIENKINHWKNNPFESYESHAARLGKKKARFCILSPDGISDRPRWKGIAYKEYCCKLRERMSEAFFDSQFSKWHMFAREFILHMEHELDDPPMTPEQIAFVEKNADEIAAVQNLSSQYREFATTEIRSALEQRVRPSKFDISEKPWPDHIWTFRCRSEQWGRTEMALYRAKGKDQKFFIRAYLADISETQISAAGERLSHMIYEIENKYHRWTASAGYNSIGAAIDGLCQLAQIVNNVLRR
jgi:hypothetical protein